MMPLLAKAHPHARTYSSLVLILGGVLSTSPGRLVAIGALTLAFAFGCGARPRTVLFGLLPVATLVMGVAALAYLSGFRTSDVRVVQTALFAGKCWIAYIATAGVLVCTHYADLLEALEYLRIPVLLTSVAGSIFRWFDITRAEAVNTNNARLLRGGDQKGFLGQVKDLAVISANVMVRCYLRAERVALAMECRGFRGSLPRLTKTPLRTADLALPSISTLCIAAVWMLIP
ncbi:MAG: energy-coupling factor transporter transmembrane component T family protein [Armatimonadota bacterium]